MFFAREGHDGTVYGITAHQVKNLVVLITSRSKCSTSRRNIVEEIFNLVFALVFFYIPGVKELHTVIWVPCRPAVGFGSAD
jgi:hypothetical protein